MGTVSRLIFISIIIVLLFSFVFFISSCGDDDDDNDSGDNDKVDDDIFDDDDNDATDDDSDDDSGDDDDAGDDDDNDDSTFPPDEQEPFIEKGLILPPDSLECTPVETGIPQTNCNHHGSTVAELPDGTMAAVWYHGVAEKSPDSRIIWSQIGPDGEAWTWPEVLYDDQDRAEGNPALWVDESGVLYVFFVTIFGDGWNQSKVRLIRSNNNGVTWSIPETLRNQYCWMTRHRPVRLENDDLLLPLYNECLAYPVFMRSKNDFTTWTEEANFSLSYYLGHLGQIQPALVLLDDGRVSAITRDGLPTHRIKRMVSSDHGLTWSSSQWTDLPNSGTSVDQARLLDGHVVVIYNDDQEERFPLTVALSHDGGETFIAIRNVNDECETTSCSYSYPSIAQNVHDGTIWVTYTHNRDTIGWIHFNEAWLIES